MNDISPIILRLLIEQIDKQNLRNFKFTSKRICNVINTDEICQIIYLKIVYNIDDYERYLYYYKTIQNLIKILDSKRYCKNFHHTSSWSIYYTIFIRPSDNNVIICYEESLTHYSTVFGDLPEDINDFVKNSWDVHKFTIFVSDLNSRGFFQMKHRYFDLESELENLKILKGFVSCKTRFFISKDYSEFFKKEILDSYNKN